MAKPKFDLQVLIQQLLAGGDKTIPDPGYLAESGKLNPFVKDFAPTQQNIPHKPISTMLDINELAPTQSKINTPLHAQKTINPDLQKTGRMAPPRAGGPGGLGQPVQGLGLAKGGGGMSSTMSLESSLDELLKNQPVKQPTVTQSMAPSQKLGGGNPGLNAYDTLPIKASGLEKTAPSIPKPPPGLSTLGKIGRGLKVGGGILGTAATLLQPNSENINPEDVASMPDEEFNKMKFGNSRGRPAANLSESIEDEFGFNPSTFFGSQSADAINPSVVKEQNLEYMDTDIDDGEVVDEPEGYGRLQDLLTRPTGNDMGGDFNVQSFMPPSFKQASPANPNKAVYKKPGESLKSGSFYGIEKGDTLGMIAKELGLTVEDLMAMNPDIKDANKIKAGGLLNTGYEGDSRLPKPRRPGNKSMPLPGY